jgi:hypothetical protein
MPAERRPSQRTDRWQLTQTEVEATIADIGLMNDLPIACELTSAELQQRRETVLPAVRRSVERVEEIKNGFAFFFSPDGDRLKELANLIDLERRCCPFLRFTLTVEAGGGQLILEITGPEGTREFLKDLFEPAN